MYSTFAPSTYAFIPEAVAARAATAYVEELRRPDLGACWISTYSTQSAGYAQVGWKDGAKVRNTTAHRAAWQHYNGPIPQGMTIDHVCHVRPCVNPWHLRLMAHALNSADQPQIKTCVETGRTCAFGHPIVQGTGKAFCRTCKNERRRRRRAMGLPPNN